VEKYMFVGEYVHSVDDKSRVAIPVKFRNLLQNGGILTRGNDGCLVVYRLNEWEKMMAKLATLPQSKQEVRNYLRFVLSGATDFSMDKQGRINLPFFLKDFAGINRKVVFVGLYDKMEIWEKDKWDEYRGQMEDQNTDYLEQLEEFGL